MLPPPPPPLCEYSISAADDDQDVRRRYRDDDEGERDELQIKWVRGAWRVARGEPERGVQIG